MPEKKPFFYGGQAIIEGVMIRGSSAVSMAVRRPSGEVMVRCEPITGVYRSRWRSIPLVRGIIVLGETLTLGTRALMFSAREATGEETEKGFQTLPSAAIWSTLLVAFGFSIDLFLVLPLFVTNALDPHISSSIASNLIDGSIRLAILLAYMTAMGRLKDVRRLFAYHGAEHMTIKAYEARQELSVDNIRQHSTDHPRCGTAFLFTVVLVSIILFAFLGRPALYLRIVERIALVPVIAALSYEVIRLNGAHAGNRFFKVLATPSLWLQRLTTRVPDNSQIEVAVKAMESALRADNVMPSGGSQQ